MSHDARKLAIIHDENIWLYDLIEKNLKKITNTPERKKWVAWSPDNQMISFWAFVENPEFEVETRIISVDGGKPISTLNNSVVFPFGWSPGNKSVVLFEKEKLMIRNIFTGEIRVLIDLKNHWLNDVSNYCWSPDGKYLVVNGVEKPGSEEKYHLLKIPIEGGKEIELAPDDLNFKYDISWSPDGRWISYCSMEMEKVRPEGIMWEADFEEILERYQ